MTAEQLKDAVLALSEDDRKEFILALLPDLAKELGSDQAFLMRLFPVMIQLVKESGMDMQQLVQLAAMFSASQNR